MIKMREHMDEVKRNKYYKEAKVIEFIKRNWKSAIFYTTGLGAGALIGWYIGSDLAYKGIIKMVEEAGGEVTVNVLDKVMYIHF